VVKRLVLNEQDKNNGDFMKVGIDIRNIGKKRTGDEVVFLNLVKHLARIDQENEYFLFTDIKEQVTIEEIKERIGILGKNNFSIISLPTRNKFVWNAWTLPRYLWKYPVDVYHTQYITPFFVSNKIKIVTSIHDVSFKVLPGLIKFFDLFFFSVLIPLSVRRANRIIAVSNFTREEIIRFYNVDPAKVTLVYNAIAENFITQYSSDEIKSCVREKYHLPEKFILYLGTMQPRKNIPSLIKAFALLIKNNPEVKLVLVGNRNGRNFDRRIDALIDEYLIKDSVIFPGFIDEDDKHAIYNCSRVFCFPSLYEGFGIPLLEAMSQRVPVLAAKIPCFQEVAGDAALYFDPNNLDFQEKLNAIYFDENLRKSLIDAGISRLRDFSWEKAANETLAIYKQLTS